ncbi:sigma-70 family RNA polymerase sigma factor [Marinomonas sp. 5E14-1]|uniref:sigma-70 family RNA polymerase sigma factor n=1 Tax=Marinomonas sp. 5E14-1 TaxID=3153922 RepID=UPI003267AC20
MSHSSTLKMQQDAMHSLYKDNHSWLYSWIRKRLDNQFDAADLAQDTFLRIHSRNDVDKIEEPRAYLAVVAKGLVSHFYRRKSLEESYYEYLEKQPEFVTSSAESQLIILQTLEEIDALLNEMPKNIKSVFLMSQIDGKKYQQIADEVGISLATVKRYMKQAYVQCLMLMESDLFE